MMPVFERGTIARNQKVIETWRKDKKNGERKGKGKTGEVQEIKLCSVPHSSRITLF